MPGDDDEDVQAPDESPDQADDAEGQVLTWKVRKPIPEADEQDAEGHAVRPSPEAVVTGMPAVDDDEVEGHGR